MRAGFKNILQDLSRNVSIKLKSSMADTRIFAISDLHVDYKQNLQFVESWSSTKYQNDILIVAGDVTDKLSFLESTLKSLQQKFKQLFYVPGNHELWIRSKETEDEDSITKFHRILAMCDRIGACHKPSEIQTSSSESVWVVPLYSWYSKPQDDMEDSLYLKPRNLTDEDPKFCEEVWMDNHLCKWTSLQPDETPSKYFSQLNKDTLSADYGNKPVITFSHFLPRSDLIPGSDEDIKQVTKERASLGLGEAPKFQGATKGFNFTRYAGSKVLDAQLRSTGSRLHIFGHQHRNRDRVVDGVRYVSHCLGNPKEQQEGWVWGISEWKGPKQVWPACTTAK